METLDRRAETHNLNDVEYLRAQDDIATQFSELVDGSMRTRFDLSFDGKELYGRDGRSMDAITLDALEAADKIVSLRPNLAFEQRRRRLEREEYVAMVAMAKGDGPNTMVVTSDFPPELVDATEDVGGYNVTRQQTMLRVIIRQPDGSLAMYSQSLDGSDRQALESIHTDLGSVVEPGELLGQRIEVDLSESDQEYLVDRLVGVHDRQMSAQHGGEWYAGRRPADYRNTYDFVAAQHDLMGMCINLRLRGKLDNHLMYDVAATMQKRFKSGTNAVQQISEGYRNEHVALLLYEEVANSGSIARSNGETFSACGETLRANGEATSLKDQLDQSGMGNRTNESTTYKFDKKMHCVVCQDKPKANEPKKMCGPCGLCRTCDTKLQKKGA